jgi:hypothetical protein
VEPSRDCEQATAQARAPCSLSITSALISYWQVDCTGRARPSVAGRQMERRALALGLASATSAQAPTVMATGLDNPRGLAFGPDGAIYVAEAGRGGASTLCMPNPGGAPGTRCYGPTGAITRVVSAGVHSRVLAGLPSLAGPTGAGATGPHDIDFGFDRAFVTIGSGGDPALLAPFKAAGIDTLASLLMISYTGQITPVADFGAYETANNPAGGARISRP